MASFGLVLVDFQVGKSAACMPAKTRRKDVTSCELRMGVVVELEAYSLSCRSPR